MSRKTSILDKEIADLLKKVREESGLSQAAVAERIGLSLKSGKGYISHLEKGWIKNPPIGTILLFLRACGASWVEFFKELDAIDFKMRHEKMIVQVQPAPTKRKIESALGGSIKKKSPSPLYSPIQGEEGKKK
uniref:XRE family transcriptional regulator n=1 Tax=candidate division WOR-3 bacterium TaxID=2052148 RepID=A0A7C6EC15_UNCW3